MSDTTRNSVLVTRPEPTGMLTAARVAELGLTPVLAPMLEVRGLTATLPPVQSLQAILATSAHAVSNIPESYRTLPLMAVGDATAEHARSLGFAKVSSAGADARALVDLVASQLQPDKGPLLLVNREGLGEPMELDLNDRGFAVIRRAVYTAVAVATLPEAALAALQGGSLRAAMFFSADTARGFVRLVEAAGLSATVAEIDALAIGDPAAVSLKSLPWRQILVAAQPNQDEMLALLK